MSVKRRTFSKQDKLKILEEACREVLHINTKQVEWYENKRLRAYSVIGFQKEIFLILIPTLI